MKQKIILLSVQNLRFVKKLSNRDKQYFNALKNKINTKKSLVRKILHFWILNLLADSFRSLLFVEYVQNNIITERNRGDWT